MNKSVSYISNLKVRLSQDLSNEVEPIYQEVDPWTKDEKGNFITEDEVKLVKIGECNLQDKINSYREETNLYSILKNIASGNADMSALNKRAGVYADISNLPDNYQALAKMSTNVDSVANKNGLSAEEKLVLKKLLGMVANEEVASTTEEVKEGE